MKQFAYRIFSFLMACVFCFFLTFPSYAVSEPNSDYTQKASFGQCFGSILKYIVGYSFGLSCPNSDDKYHHADSVYEYKEKGYYDCICKYCGDHFDAYETDLQQSYKEQVAELPAQEIDSSGGMVYSAPFTYLRVGCSTSIKYPERYISFGNDPKPGTATIASLESIYGFPVFLKANNTSFDVSFGINGYVSFQWWFFFKEKAPVSGTYIPIQKSLNLYEWDEEGQHIETENLWLDGSLDSFYLIKGADLLEPDGNLLDSLGCDYFRYVISAPTVSFRVVPDDTSIVTSDTYNINTRPTSITGNYGIIGDNGQITKVEGNTIVNETNNTYYNPATGQTDTIKDWSYNYEDRSYTLTLGGGTTSTVTYGDENVTIKEGDTIYNVYYLADSSGTDTPSPGPDTPAACEHTWTETGRTEPTCSTVGKVTSTCSKCNQTKTETVPALGHTWTVDRTVQTTYDEQGNLLQQGYTIYVCPVCGEQYKDMEGTGPPGEENDKSIWEQLGNLIGSGLGGLLGLVEAVAGKLLDAITSLVDMLMGKLKTVVEAILSIFAELPALFGGFMDFLAAVFPFLPAELMTILTFGVIAIVAIGIIKAVRR